MEIVHLEDVTRTKGDERKRLRVVDLFHHHGEVSIGVLDSIVNGLLNVRGEFVEVEGLVGPDVESGKTGEQEAFRWVGWAEPEEEVDDAEDVG